MSKNSSSFNASMTPSTGQASKTSYQLPILEEETKEQTFAAESEPSAVVGTMKPKLAHTVTFGGSENSTPPTHLKEVEEEDSSGRKVDRDSDSVGTPAGNVDERSPNSNQ